MRKFYSALLATAAAVIFTGCQNKTFDQDQFERRKASLIEAASSSEVVSIRSRGGVFVLVNFEFGPEKYCADLLATWSASPRENWIEFDELGSVSRSCVNYVTAQSVKLGDLRDCKDLDCLWIRGIG